MNRDDLAAYIGNRMKRALYERNISIESYSRLAGVTRQTVYRWIRGETLPPVDRIYDLAGVTQKPIGFFLPGADAEVRYLVTLKPRTGEVNMKRAEKLLRGLESVA